MVSTVGSTVDASVPGGDAIMSDASTDAPCDNGINPAMAKLASYVAKVLQELDVNQPLKKQSYDVVKDFRMVASTSNDQGKYGSQKVVTIVQPSVVEGQEVTVASHVSMVKEAIIVLWLLLRRATMDDHCQMSM
ncbi:hypothetical protein V6N13_094049 [Hibiscus sabdariffa]